MPYGSPVGGGVLDAPLCQRVVEDADPYDGFTDSSVITFPQNDSFFSVGPHSQWGRPYKTREGSLRRLPRFWLVYAIGELSPISRMPLCL